MKNITCRWMALSALVVLMACNNAEPEKREPTDKKEPVTAKKKKPEVTETLTRGPIINITDSITIRRHVLFMKDSAATMDRIALKLGAIYGNKLSAFIKKNNLKVTGAPMAWYKKTKKGPYFFEAGMPVDKKPARLPANIQYRETGGDSMIVAHFYGPYEQISVAYDALEDWMKDHKKQATKPPYETYIDDPVDEKGNPKDPYRVLTDVVFPWR